MKKFLIFSMAVVLFATSCSKDKSSQNKPPVNSGKKYAVTFNVSGFTQTLNTNAINKKTLDDVAPGSVASGANVLYYYVQNSAGVFVSQIKETPTSAGANFGTITDQLPAGTYTVAFLAGQTGLKTLYLIPDYPTSIGFHGFYFTYNIAPGQFAPWQDTFFKKFTLTVTDQPVTQAVSLDRVVGEIQLDIKDAIPDNLKTIKFTFNYEYSGYRMDVDTAFNTFQTPRSYLVTSTIPDSVIGKTDYKINTIIGNTSTPIDVTITCLDAANNTLSVTTVPSVRCQKNLRTVLSGSLFSDASAFKTYVDTAWASTPVKISF